MTCSGMQTTDVMPTKTGFLILQVGEHYSAGQQPEDKVDAEIKDRLYNDKLRPALRAYLEMLREDSYVEVKPGYTDYGSSGLEHNRRSCPYARRRRQSKKKKNKQPATLPARKKNGE